MPVEVEEGAGAQPLRLQADALRAAGDREVVEEGGVEEQRGGQRHEGQAQAAQAQRQEGQHDGDGAARAAPMRPPTSMFSPRWMASWAEVKAPIPAKVRLAERQLPGHAGDQGDGQQTIERARPLLKTASQVTGIQVSMETQNAAKSTHHAVRMMRSMLGAPVRWRRSAAAADRWWPAGPGSSRGSACPGRKSRAATMTKNGSDGHDGGVEEAVRAGCSPAAPS